MRSDVVKKGITRTAHRTLFHAMGYSDEDLSKPLIGVVDAFNEIIPGHIHLRDIAQAVKLGVSAAGGTPIEFPAIGICDGIAMGHSGMRYPLASRELICDSIEAVANAHAFDGLVLIPNCDKIVPGMLMAAGRLNIPAVVVSGGPIALVHDGDLITVDVPNRKLELHVSDEELAKRKSLWTPPEPKVKTGYLSRYARLVTSANTGAVLK